MLEIALQSMGRLIAH